MDSQIDALARDIEEQIWKNREKLESLGLDPGGSQGKNTTTEDLIAETQEMLQEQV